MMFSLKFNSSSLFFFPYLLLILLSWRTTMRCNIHDFWTCVQYNTCLPLEICLILFLWLFIIYPQPLLSQRESSLMHPYIWSFEPLTMENTFLSTSSTWWEGSARKDITGTSPSSFPLYDFITWPQATVYIFLSTARIVISSSLTKT